MLTWSLVVVLFTWGRLQNMKGKISAIWLVALLNSDWKKVTKARLFLNKMNELRNTPELGRRFLPKFLIADIIVIMFAFIIGSLWGIFIGYGLILLLWVFLLKCTR